MDSAAAIIELKKLDIKNLREIALIHLEAFPDSSWSKLGKKVVGNYYLWQLTGPHQIVSATGAFINQKCAGFCISGVFNGSTSGFIKKNRFLLLRKTLMRPWLILDSVFFERLNEGVRLHKRFSAPLKSTGTRVEKKLPSFGILSLAVSTSYQNLGIGKKLMENAEQAAVANGYEQMHLTVNPANLQAVRFYEKMNWQQVPEGNAWRGLMNKKQLTRKIAR